MDWKQIKREYIAGGTSYRKLCEKYGVPLSNLKRVAINEGWVELRNQCNTKAATKIVEIESDKQAERMKRLLTVSDKLLEAVEDAVEQFQAGELLLDKGALKSLSGTIKDIKDIQSIKTTLDIEEQKARIAILKKQAERDDNGNDESYGVVLMPTIMEILHRQRMTAMDNVVWSPQPRQEAFMSRPEDEALYGGAAGGGKSDALVIEATRQVNIPHYKGLILRKTYPQLTELIEKSQKYYPKAFPKAKYNDSKHTWTFPSGAKIIFGSMQHSKNKLDYQGKAYDFIAFDELTHFTYDEYIYLSSRNRPNGAGTRCYIRATANPGGIGHGWVKERFITAAEPMTTVWEKVNVQHPNGTTDTRYKSRIFVPSSVFDNKILLENDPEYLTRLASLPEAERKALLYGDWDSYSGQFFTEWRDKPEHYDDRRWTHVINPFAIPDGWKIYRSFDWGYNKPFSCGWWAIDYDGVAYRILELYGCTKTPNEGLKWTAQQVFAEIHRIECEHEWLKGKKITGVADPAIFAADGGESIAESASRNGVYFTPGDHQRIPGWMQMHYRLAFDDNGYPMMYVFKNCKAFIRTVPTLIFDDHKVEDLDTEGEDHIADETRYFCMSRPIKPRAMVAPDPYNESPLKTIFDIPKGMATARTPVPKMEIIDGG